MAGIFLSGGSGLGKTTFVKLMERTYGLKSITEVIRTMHKTHPDIKDLEFLDKQFIYEIEYFKLLHIQSFNFLSDRSIFDVFVWTGRAPSIVKYLGLDSHPPDLLILLPTPTFEWYRENIEYFTRDMIRLNAYRDKFDLKHTNRLSEEEIATLIYGIEREHEKQMLSMCEMLDWPFFVPEIKRSDYQNFQSNWQKEAEEAIIQIWNVPRLSLDNMPEEDKAAYFAYKEQVKAMREKAELSALEESLTQEGILDAGIVRGEEDGTETTENTN